MWGKRICKQPKQWNLNCDADDEHERVFAKLAKERAQQTAAAVCNLPLRRLRRMRGSCLLGSLTLISDTRLARLLGGFLFAKEAAVAT